MDVDGPSFTVQGLYSNSRCSVIQAQPVRRQVRQRLTSAAARFVTTARFVTKVTKRAAMPALFVTNEVVTKRAAMPALFVTNEVETNRAGIAPFFLSLGYQYM